MKAKQIVLFISVLIGCLSLLIHFLFFNTESTEIPRQLLDKSVEISPTPSTYQASFAIFTNNTFRVFTDPRYHHLSADVYLEPSRPNVIQVKKANLTWQDFFNTLPMKLTTECIVTGTQQTFCTTSQNRLKFYINGQPDPQALTKIIQAKDQLLVTFGNDTQETITSQLHQIPVVE